MMLEAIFEYIKRNPRCSIHEIAKQFQDEELNILNAVLELQSRGYISQTAAPLGSDVTKGCAYTAVKEHFSDDAEFCQCKQSFPVTADTEGDDWGYWMICCGCGKRKEDSFHYYDRYDGEDHDDLDIF